jgi:hypothetical protein
MAVLLWSHRPTRPLAMSSLYMSRNSGVVKDGPCSRPHTTSGGAAQQSRETRSPALPAAARAPRTATRPPRHHQKVMALRGRFAAHLAYHEGDTRASGVMGMSPCITADDPAGYVSCRALRVEQFCSDRGPYKRASYLQGDLFCNRRLLPF